METVITAILAAAKSVGVSGALLLAICNHESGGFKHNYAAADRGSPSYGSCQIKYASAKLLGFHGYSDNLNNPIINARYAALYLKYQQDRYGDNWVKLASAYNAGRYRESSLNPGCPKNRKYLRFIQKKLPLNLQDRLNCGTNRQLAENL